MAPLFGPRWAVVLAALSGFAIWLAFAPVAIGWLAILGVALLTAAAWGASVRRGLLVGFIAGLTFFPLLLLWMRVVGMDAWVLLSLFCALWFALLGAGTALVTRLPAAPVWVGALWVLEEALRGRVPLGGFPWGDLVFAQPDTLLLRYAALGGAAFVSFVVAVIGASLVAAFVSSRRGGVRSSAMWVAVAVILVIAPVAIRVPTAGDTDGGPDSAVVAVIQGGTPHTGMGAFDVRREVLDNHVAQTIALAQAVAAGTEEQPDFVLWPENSSDIDPFEDPTAADAISTAARAINVPILVGAVITAGDDPTRAWNVGIVWDPVTGPGQMYVKTHPVPFGEYIPFRDLLASRIERLGRIARDFAPGSTPGNLTIADIPVGNVICFEVAYDEIVAAVVDGGARLLTVQTNNATFAGGSQPAQQLAISRVRATEFGRTVAIAATSGISAIIAPDSSITSQLDEGQTGWLVQRVALRGGSTPAAIVGGFVLLGLCGLAVGAVVASIVLGRRSRSPRQPIA